MTPFLPADLEHPIQQLFIFDQLGSFCGHTPRKSAQISVCLLVESERDDVVLGDSDCPVTLSAMRVGLGVLGG